MHPTTAWAPGTERHFTSQTHAYGTTIAKGAVRAEALAAARSGKADSALDLTQAGALGTERHL